MNSKQLHDHIFIRAIHGFCSGGRSAGSTWLRSGSNRTEGEGKVAEEVRLEDFAVGGAFWRERMQKAGDAGSQLGRAYPLLGEADAVVEHLLQHFLVVAIVKGEMAGPRDVKNDSDGPDVSWPAEIVLVQKNLRGHVGSTPTVSLALFRWSDVAGKAEIRELHVLPLVEQNVLALQVAMTYPLFVQIRHGFDELTEGDFDVHLLHSFFPSRLDVLEFQQKVSRTEFGRKDNEWKLMVEAEILHSEEVENAAVFYLLTDLDLSGQELPHKIVVPLRADDLDSYSSDPV